jgi:nucleoside-diphosphate-sugar epimerase
MDQYKEGMGTYNIGRTDNPVSMERVAQLACDITGAGYDFIQMIDAPKNQTRVKRLSNKKLLDLGWKPSVDIEIGMAKVLDYVKTLD